MSLTYSKNGDYLIPNLKIEQPKQPIGKYGMMRRTFLKEHRKADYNIMLMTGTLAEHLIEMDQTVRREAERIIEQLKKNSQEPDKDKYPAMGTPLTFVWMSVS